jgi:hypothetical protein
MERTLAMSDPEQQPEGERWLDRLISHQACSCVWDAHDETGEDVVCKADPKCLAHGILSALQAAEIERDAARAERDSAHKSKRRWKHLYQATYDAYGKEKRRADLEAQAAQAAEQGAEKAETDRRLFSLRYRDAEAKHERVLEAATEHLDRAARDLAAAMHKGSLRVRPDTAEKLLVRGAKNAVALAQRALSPQ